MVNGTWLAAHPRPMPPPHEGIANRRFHAGPQGYILKAIFW
jgi:hypothetical protein